VCQLCDVVRPSQVLAQLAREGHRSVRSRRRRDRLLTGTIRVHDDRAFSRVGKIGPSVRASLRCSSEPAEPAPAGAQVSSARMGSVIGSGCGSRLIGAAILGSCADLHPPPWQPASRSLQRASTVEGFTPRLRIPPAWPPGQGRCVSRRHTDATCRRVWRQVVQDRCTRMAY
jgi:hypothetical protein